jgi:hypothetical protein
MARMSSQGTVISIQAAADAAPATIASVTKAKPAVLTMSATLDPTLVVGAVVTPKGTGFASLDGRTFKVVAIDATAKTVELGGSDTSKEAGTMTAGATLANPTMIELCRSTLTLSSPAGATVEVTTLCDTGHRIVSGLPAISTYEANGFFDIEDAAMLTAREYYASGEIVAFDARFPDGSGMCWQGNVNSFNVAAGINAAITNNIGGQVDGLTTIYPPAP